MSSAKNVGDWLGKNRFDENFQSAAADESVVVAGFVVQVKDHFAGSLFGENIFGCGPDVGFDAAAADGSGDGAVFTDEHAGTFKAGDGAVGVDDGGQGASEAGFAHSHDFFEEVHGEFQVQPTACGARCQRGGRAWGLDSFRIRK